MGNKIELGDKVKDIVTGFTGIVVGITTWLHGCSRIGVQGPLKAGEKPSDPAWIDELQLVVVKKAQVTVGSRENGGPIPAPQRRPDPSR